jgi:uncharacterized SAM-binding protein YcdF (DUF218 family)
MRALIRVLERGLMLFLLCHSGCADFRDLFTPYRLRPREVAEVLALPIKYSVYDAALVLGCPANPDGTPSLCERCRVKTAVRLYRRGFVKNLIFSGNAAHSPHVEADVMADLAERRGVPKEHVLREPRALTTWQNLRFSLAILRAHHFKTAFIISTADHLPRARRMAHFFGLDDAHTAYRACDLDLPPDSDAEFAPPPPPTPTVID